MSAAQSENVSMSSLGKKLSRRSDFGELVNQMCQAIEADDANVLDPFVDHWLDLIQQDLAHEAWQELVLGNPLAYAIRHQQASIIAHLVEEKELRLPLPCAAPCHCRLCLTLKGDLRFHQLYSSNILFALTSWEYVSVAYTSNPIDFCLEIWEAIQSSRMFRVYSQEGIYRELHARSEAAMLRFLDCSMNEKEVTLLLCDDAFDNPSEHCLVKMGELIDARMKKAISHPAVQSLLSTHWEKYADALFGPSNPISNWPWILRLLFYVFCYFVLVPISIIFPHPRLVHYLKSPSTVYNNEALSYWMFLIFISSTFFYPDRVNHFLICGTQFHIHNCLIGLLILSRTVRTCDGLWNLGKGYFSCPYEILQCISGFLYVTGASMLFVANHVVPLKPGVKDVCTVMAFNLTTNKNLTSEQAIKSMMSRSTTECEAVKLLYNLGPKYTLFVDGAIEPHNLAAFFFAIGHLFYYISAGSVLYMNRLIAHLNIAVTRMAIDVVRWGLLMLLFFFAWALAMTSLYRNYSCENDFFSNVKLSMLEMFWVLFAMTERADYKMTGLLSRSDHKATEVIQYTGFFLYGTYYIIANLVLVNLLIAIMAVTFQKVEDERLTEMAFWRTRIQIKYINWHKKSILPSPFNVFLPILWLFKKCWKRCYERDARKLLKNEEDAYFAEELGQESRAEMIKYILQRRVYDA